MNGRNRHPKSATVLAFPVPTSLGTQDEALLALRTVESRQGKLAPITVCVELSIVLCDCAARAAFHRSTRNRPVLEAAVRVMEFVRLLDIMPLEKTVHLLPSLTRRTR